MSKVAAYLQEHILGEVSTNPGVLAALSHDLSVLEITPEMAVYPRVTNDIRKVARFTWQLAEKGHVMPLTPRGAGSDETGGAIGKGISLVMTAHMNRIFEFDAKQKLVRVQPGANAAAVNSALLLQGMMIPSLPASAQYGTLGGIVASGDNGPLAGKYGDVSKWVSQLEVVLANGDILQTERLSKRELNKRKGMQTLEGEIYRNLDNLIEDNAQLIAEKIATDVRDNTGYTAISQVKQKDGSFDLTPLIVGSQGTLGIISEMIMKTEFVSSSVAVAAIAFKNNEMARDALDQLVRTEPAFLELYDGDLFAIAEARGKKYDFLKNAGAQPSAVVLIGFDDFSDRARSKKLKKVEKLFSKAEVYMESYEGEPADELMALREVTALVAVPDGKTASAPPIIDGAYVPRERTEEFLVAVKDLATKHAVVLPFHARVLDNTFYARPILQLHKIGDKQKVFKLLDEYASLVAYFGGHLIGNGSEGRVKARFAYAQLDPDVLELFGAIKAVFDPHGILNPGVKQPNELRQLIPHLRSSYDTAAIAGHVPHN
jgi:FAD/FMN-containing dehydrogenase